MPAQKISDDCRQRAMSQRAREAKERYEHLPRAVRSVISGSASVGFAYVLLQGLCKAYRTIKRRTLRALLFQAVIPALSKACVSNYYVDFGTLLGLYKKGDILKFDNDTDIVILEPNPSMLLEELPKHLPKGYTVKEAGPGRDLGGGVKAKWIRVWAPNKIFWCDLFFGYIQGDKIRISKGIETDLLTPMVLPLGQMHVQAPGSPGQDVPVPADVEMVLRTRYGPDWHVDKYASKGRDVEEHNKFYLRAMRAFGKLGLRV